MTVSRSPRERAFTLIELMLVVGLIGILSTLAIGTSQSWRRKQDHRELVREAFNALNLARAHSLQFGVTTKVQFDDTNDRLTAFVEPAATADCRYTGAVGETIIYQYPPQGGVKVLWVVGLEDVYDSDMSLTVADPAECSSRHTVVFDHRGFSIALDRDARSPTVSIADSQSGETMQIDVSVAGALRVR